MNLQKLRPQDKMVDVNRALGNDFIQKMQGTTKTIYDTLPVVAGQNQYNFFKDTNNRVFPFCNVQNSALPVAESLAVQRFYLSVLIITPGEEGEADNYELKPLDSAITAPGLSPLGIAEMQFTLANDVVMKPIQIANTLPQYNKTSFNNESNVFEFNTNLIIPPQLNFEFNLRTLPLVPASGEGVQTFLRLVIEGVGSQFNGKVNF
jgi:hypothetical protein